MQTSFGFFGMDIRQKLNARRTAALNNNARYESLRNVPQRRQSYYEIAAYFILPMLLIAAGAMPPVAVFLMPAILPLLYLLFRRFGGALPFSCVAFYALFSLVFAFDILTVVYAVFLFFALIGSIVSAQLKHYLLCMATAAVFAVFGAVAGMGIIRLAVGRPLGDIGAEYVEIEIENPFIDYLAHDYYESIDIPAEIGRLKPEDDGYAEAVCEFFAEYVRDELESYAPYICVHLGGLVGLIAYFISVVVNRRTAGAYDYDISREEVALSSRCLGGVRCEPTPIAKMKFPRSYLWAVLLPALGASLILDLVGGYGALSATIMHAFITLPSAAAFVTLCAFFVSLFKGKVKIVAYAVFFALMLSCVVFSVVLFFASMIGLCDIILNLRYWTDFIRKEG
ncbi:MAG: hypothetical protein K2M48_02175 [Clostridiales bacterium]|nr:hypothetical protein [Clostridiales bacterium]